MRLGTCIALELVLAAGAVGGVWFGVGRATELAGSYFDRPAQAATSVARRPVVTPLLETLPRAHLAVAQPVVHTVFPAPDDELLAPLGTSTVTRLKLNHGGTSLSLRLDFANGARAAFKPEQTHPQSDPRREIAAYRLDRLLGIGHVPPAKAATIAVSELIEAALPEHRTFVGGRIADEAIARDGMLHGELSWWVPEIKLATLGAHRIDEKDGKAVWTALLQHGVEIPEAQRGFVAQIATLILFDVLIDNPDRWTGSNTMMSPDGQVLFFMDNTLSFSIFGLGHEQNVGALRRIEVFPRGLVAKLRALTPEVLEAALSVGDDHGLAPLLEPRELRAILVRRDNMLKYIDRVIAEYGEAAVLALP